MKRALELARIAAKAGDVPVGAVIVRDGEIIAEAYNEREISHSATSHAEVLAIERACATLGRWRLSDCEMYVTLEPCPMCAGALLNARIGAVHYALADPRSGSLGSVLDLNSYPLLYRISASVGLCADESRELMSGFFCERRRNSKK